MASDHGDWGGRPIISERDWRSGSEYGGVEGLIQPRDSGHDPANNAHEQLMLIYNTDPADELSGTDLPPTPKMRGYGD